MKKTLVITIMIDDVDTDKISEVSENLEEMFGDYQYKRIDINLSNTPMIKPRSVTVGG